MDPEATNESSHFGLLCPRLSPPALCPSNSQPESDFSWLLGGSPPPPYYPATHMFEGFTTPSHLHSLAHDYCIMSALLLPCSRARILLPVHFLRSQSQRTARVLSLKSRPSEEPFVFVVSSSPRLPGKITLALPH